MDGRLLKLLAGTRSASLPDGRSLEVLPAQALLEARAEAAAMKGDAEAAGLRLGACLLARALREGGRPVFSSGEEVLNGLSAERITALLDQYVALSSVQREEELPQLQALLGQEEPERLKWRVLRAFGVLPSEERARRMTLGDYYLCAMHLALDAEEQLARLCPECREKAAQARCPACGAMLDTVNAGFDEKRYEELRHGTVYRDAFAKKPDADGAGV